VAHRGAELSEAQAALSEVAGDALAAPGAEEVTATADAVHLLSSSWRFPADTPGDLRQQLMTEDRREALVERWPNLPLKVLNGRSPAQAASDPAAKIKLLAAILILEMSGEQLLPDFDYNELRRKLNLPTLGPVDPW